MGKSVINSLQALLANKIEIFLAHCISVVSLWFLVAVLFCLGEQNSTLAGGSQLREMMAQVNLILGLVVGPNAAVLLYSVGSVHAGSTFPAIQGASLTTLSSQPNSLVTGGFPAEDEQHSQPVSPQGLHYLHSAYRVGKDSQVGFYGPLERDSGQGCRFSLLFGNLLLHLLGAMAS